MILVAILEVSRVMYSDGNSDVLDHHISPLFGLYVWLHIPEPDSLEIISKPTSFMLTFTF